MRLGLIAALVFVAVLCQGAIAADQPTTGSGGAALSAATTDSATSTTLFPTGQLDQLPKDRLDPKLPIVELKLAPPPDAAERRRRFADRNSSAALGQLCEEFRRVLKRDTPGLEAFERLYQERKHLAALEAYRDYFFAKLATPEKYGAMTENLHEKLARSCGKGTLLKYPSKFALEQILNNCATVQFRGEVLVGEIGPPGAVPWAPLDAKPPAGSTFGRDPDQGPYWKTAEGQELRRKVELCRAINRLPSTDSHFSADASFRALLFSYAVSGEREHLARWCAYMDDRCLHAKSDLDACGLNIRAAVELETQELRTTLTLLRIILDERPELAKDFDATTLARFMMTWIKEAAPYTIRARRAEMANWGNMGLSHGMHVFRLLPEFAASEYFNRELWRLWRINFIQHRTLDGENYEAWDVGHNTVDIEYAQDSVPYARLPAEADALDQQMFWDDVAVNQRSLLVHMSAGGNYWPAWDGLPDNSLRKRYLQPQFGAKEPWLQTIAGEEGARRRIEAVVNAGKPSDTPLPDRTADIAPYGAMHYLRENWRPESELLVLQDFVDRGMDGGDSARTLYTLSKADRVLAQAHSIVVDRKPDNRHYGKPRTGGKIDFVGQAGRRVVDSRFHESPRFQFTEARQQAPYARYRVNTQSANPYGLYSDPLTDGDDPDAVKDVQAVRQVFALRGEGLYLVADRIENRSTTRHEYTQFFTLPIALSAKGLAERVKLLQGSRHRFFDIDEAGQRFRTDNPGVDNVSLYCFATQPLTFANRLNRRREHETIKNSPLDEIASELNKGQPADKVLKRLQQWPVSARWTAAGNQSLITAIRTRSAISTLEPAYSNEPAKVDKYPGGPGVVGCRTTTRDGNEVLFQSGPELVNRLTCGDVSAEAEALLVVRQEEGRDLGIVIGCKSMTVDGKPVELPGVDFEFRLACRPGATPSLLSFRQLIHRPIDTVQISPPQNVFTDSVQVSFDIPTQKTDYLEFRYTLDGAEPTLESPRYDKPFTLRQTTLVKVRPFRKRLKETPWHFTGTECGRTISAVFRQQALEPPMRVDLPSTPGVLYEYFEGDWPTLFTYAGIEDAVDEKSHGYVRNLLDPDDLARIRKTDRAFAVRYSALMNVPRSGVYSFYAPQHLYSATMDAGYDLRLFIDDKEWFPSPTLHSENVWHIALAQGKHRLRLAYVDYREKKFRDEYWMSWQAEEMWSGVPVLEVSGPELTKQRLPAAWLSRRKLGGE